MVRLYHEFGQRFGGEPTDLWVYGDGDRDDRPTFVTPRQVMVWPADHGCDVATFVTLGMSDHRMTGADYYCELTLGVRARLRKSTREVVARYLSHVSVYPFQYGRKFDWWEVMTNPGDIPQFPGCRHLLLRDRLTAEGFDTVDDPDGPVKLLYVVPITPLERHLVLDHGPAALQTHWDEHGTDILSDRSDPT